MSVSPPAGFRAALDRLNSAQKSPKGAPAYSRFVNRRLGRLFAAAGYTAGLTPNQVTAISGLFTFGGIALLAYARPTAPVGVAVCLALVIGYALDAADGQLARLRGGGSPVGEWLDHVCDSAKIPLLHLAVAVSCFRFSALGRGEFLLVPLAFAAVATVTFFSMIISDFLRRTRPVAAATGTNAPIWRSLLVLPSDYGLLCLIFVLLGAGTAFSAPFCVAYAALAAANALYLLGVLLRGYRAMTALGVTTPTAATGATAANGAVATSAAPGPLAPPAPAPTSFMPGVNVRVVNAVRGGRR
ncbi:CDP-alcohol phosphatidyltransferase [Parafrankia irregularis]|uniref:CDP-alcohol phosphatidyltransferase n=1 Tax=Parafrankia irregularis TaxID=795642 RepID=A0A0S4QIP2_9ACTN|nr:MULTISPECIES: CDP-alcohol phosphatidyltransferase family protein [Parafrankia]MBE3205701.1 CDP-alcohol phosphatidyltransferase family protein [Parafrankia sp. CH37]CUU55399.1 CDP-alcohol phosphatidyltransferase [Parafrankia irregularis]